MDLQHQTGQQAQTGIMPEPPSVVSTKDLSYLMDAMSWELMAMKKCYSLSQQCMDSDLKQSIDKVGRMHQRHYETLLKHVDPRKSITNM